MKHIKLFWIISFLVILISACSTQGTPPPASPDQPTSTADTDLDPPTETPPPTEVPPTQTSTPLPTATTDPDHATINQDVNATIAALLDKNIDTLLNTIQMNSQPCTTQDGLGGPPKCPAGINDGTVLSFFPVIGPGEGSHLNPDEVGRVFDYQQPVLFAVVQINPPETYDPVFPSGSYAVILETEPQGFARTFRLGEQGEIVRVDYTVWSAEQEMSNIEGSILYQK